LLAVGSRWCHAPSHSDDPSGEPASTQGLGGLAPQTVQHIHRLLSQILSSAVKAQKLRLSPMLGVQTAPKVRREEIRILNDDELATLFKRLKGRSLYMPVLLAASTGMRRGEVLALRCGCATLAISPRSLAARSPPRSYRT
jgi:integrase